MITSTAPLELAVVSQHYDDLDPFYRRFWGEHVHHGLWRTRRESAAAAVENLIVEVAALAALSTGDRVCDIRCGYGGTARFLARRFGARVTGITVGEAQAAYAIGRADSADSVDYCVEDWLRNGLADASFDAALAIESTEHMSDLDACYREAARVLRPGGRLAVCAWVARDDPPAWQATHLLEPICREGRMYRLATQDQHRRARENAGFTVIADRDVTCSVARTWTICIARALRSIVLDRSTRRFLLDDHETNRVFAITLLRLRAAYALGAMRYHILAGELGG